MADAAEGDEDRAGRERLSSFVATAWRLCLGRDIPQDHLNFILADLAQGSDPIAFFLSVATCPEAQQRPTLMFPPGHYYSPIVNPRELSARNFAAQRQSDKFVGIKLDYDAMEAWFRAFMAAIADLRLPLEPTPDWRYHAGNGWYDIGDATILCGILRRFRPRRWIEIGSGFSTAILLDAIDRTPGLDIAVTVVDPELGRVKNLCSEADLRRVHLVEDIVQNLPLEMFASLECDDVLFIDSTHLCKTGSDVNHEIFQILPRLQKGVVVHFHDFFVGFEYPESWIYDENRSWNEQYILRAFLMYNAEFEIVYANDDFAHARREVVAALRPEILLNYGGGFWLRRT